MQENQDDYIEINSKKQNDDVKNFLDEKFDISAVEKTFTTYKKGQTFDGVVVIKRPDGLIFNIGGKNDAFIPANDFDDYDEVKIGDRFKVLITNTKNDQGLIEASKKLADDQIIGTQNAVKLKLGSTFSFVVTDGSSQGLHSHLGEYKIFIPIAEISSSFVRDAKKYVGKQLEAVVTEIKKEEKSIIGSVKLLNEQLKEAAETMFWSSIFPNKIVKGSVKKILPYGAFIDVEGVDCFLHISNISHKRIENPSEVLAEGQEVTTRVIELDRDNKKIALSMKVLEESPKKLAIKALKIGEKYKGKVVKILKFGAIVALENGASGLLHVSNATEDRQAQIYQIVKLDDEVTVEVIDKNEEEERVAFKLV